MVARGEATWGKSHLELLLHTFLLESRGSRYSLSAPGQAPANGHNLLEVKGDIFQLTKYDEAMAHCVSEDMEMGAGIALKFRDMMSGDDLKELLSQKRKVGEVAILRPEGRGSFIYNLVTKERYYQKPTYESLTQSLYCMKTHCLENYVDTIAMPQIGCGLDKLDWVCVQNILKEVFMNTSVTIKIFSFDG